MTTPTASSPSRWNPWPVSIVTFFSLAILGCTTFVVFCSRHPADLISTNYYEDEVKYQGQIDRLQHTQQQAPLASVRYDALSKIITLSLPPEHTQAKPSGQIHLYRPSAAALDRQVRLDLNANGIQMIDAGSFRPGLWKIRVSWTVANREVLHRSARSHSIKNLVQFVSMIAWTALMLGLVGSLHCAGMCGPLALAIPVVSSTRTGLIAGRLAYNLGRMLTYCVLGLIFGLVGRTLLMAGIQRWASISLGVVLLLGLASSLKLALWRPVTALIARLKISMSGLLRRRSLAALVLLGMLNGLLPCGLVYVACAGATATESLLEGGQYMFLFGLGTVPMMLGIGLSGRLVPVALRLRLLKAIPVSVLLLASLLILRGLSLGIPYLSPDLSSATPSCCHK